MALYPLTTYVQVSTEAACIHHALWVLLNMLGVTVWYLGLLLIQLCGLME